MVGWCCLAEVGGVCQVVGWCCLAEVEGYVRW